MLFDIIIMIGRILLGLFVLFIVWFFIDLDGNTRLVFPRPGYKLSDIPSQKGKVVIITGGTTGVGRASAEQLCLRDAKLIIITSRYQKKADEAAQEIQKNFCHSGSKVIGQALQMEDHISIEMFANWFRTLGEKIDILMLNAGVSDMEKTKTSLGLERTVGINWFGSFYLQQLLQDIIEESAPSRIVLTSSRGSALAPTIDKPIYEYVNGSDTYGFQQYGLSKLFNIYHAMELHRRLREKGIKNIYVLAAHPGLVATDLFSFIRGDHSHAYAHYLAYKKSTELGYENGFFLVLFSFLADYVGIDTTNGALSQLYAATSPEVEKLDISGEYIYPIARRENRSFWYMGTLSNLPPQTKDAKLAKDLWNYGESIIASIQDR